MKIQQEKLPFRPITIKLEKHSEVMAFIRLIDKVDSHVTHRDGALLLDVSERKTLIKISNEFTELLGLRD